MKLLKINTDHYIVVDDSEIKEGDWLLDTTDNTIWDCHKDMPNSLFPECKKITYSTQPLEYIEDKDEFGTHKVQGFDKIQYLPLQELKEIIGEMDEELLIPFPDEQFRNGGEINAWMKGWEIGYNQALEDNKEFIKKPTEWNIEIDSSGKIKLK